MDKKIKICRNAADELLFSISEKDKSRYAMHTEEKKIRYEEYITEVEKYMKLLVSIYGTQRAMIGLVMDDCLEFIYIFWACIKLNLVPVLVNNKFTDTTIMKCFDSAMLGNIIIDVERSQKVFSKENSYLNAKCHNKVLFFTKKSKIKRIENQVAFGIFTSGSTGIPKCVLHTHESMIRCVNLYYKETLKIKCSDIVYSASKMMHTYGLGNTVFQTVGIRASSVVCADGTVHSIISNIHKYRPTIFFATPSVYQEILIMAEEKEIDLSSINSCFSAGEYLSPSLYEDFLKKFGLKIFDGMGNTEYLTTFISNTREAHKKGSCGKCIAGFEAKVLDNNGKRAKKGMVGRLYIKGLTNFYGYYGEQKVYTATEYFNTNNLCYMDDDDFIWFVGRENMLFKVRGRWVNPLEIENLLEEVEDIEESLVINDSRERGNEIILYIKLKKEKGVTDVNLKHRIKVMIKKRLEHYKCPSKIIVLKFIPKGATGKKIREKIVDQQLIIKEL